MKIRSYNGSEHIPSECGSFTIVSRELNKQFKKLGVYSEDSDSFVVVPECLNTQQQFKNQIPFLACEYSQPPSFVTHWLNQYQPKVFCISQFAKDNLVRGGYPEDKIFVSLLGHDGSFWKPMDIEKFPIFTFITVNTSNDRSGFEVFIPEFLKFAKNKNVRLIVKDGENENFKNWLFSLPGTEEKIIYDGWKINRKELKELYCKSHVNIYYNHTTSYGLNINDGALCGLPTLATFGSAIREFLPKWTQPFLVMTGKKSLNEITLNTWRNIGLHTPPSNFYPFGTTRESILPDNIRLSLEYVYENYLEMLRINQLHQELIRKVYTWENTVQRLIDILK